MPAAARPGAITVGGVINRLVEVVFAGLVILIADDAPDVVPIFWAHTGVVIERTTNAIHIRMAEYS